jgi:hypothetical protein
VDQLAMLRAFVDDLDNFQTIGRNGLHRYNNQDHAMLTGSLAARNLLHDEMNDLWNVNVDQEYHEEIVEGHDPAAETAIRGALAQAFQKIDPVALGLSLGTTAGVLLAAVTLFLVAKGGVPVGPTLALLGQFFPGYSVTLGGSLLGLAYGFLAGFLGGWSFGFVRNIAFLLLMRPEADRPRTQGRLSSALLMSI